MNISVQQWKRAVANGNQKKEEAMSDEIQFENEEQFIDIMKLVTAADKKSPEMLRYVKNAKIYHLIKKPEIEQAIEDVEKMWKSLVENGWRYCGFNSDNFIDKQHNLIILLKKFYKEHK